MIIVDNFATSIFKRSSKNYQILFLLHVEYAVVRGTVSLKFLLILNECLNDKLTKKGYHYYGVSQWITMKTTKKEKIKTKSYYSLELLVMMVRKHW